jgi:methyl-accepting chemotaxis protein
MKISVKIIVSSLLLVLLVTAAFLVTVLVQRGKLVPRMESLVREQGHLEADRTVQMLYHNCVAIESRNQSRLTHDLNLAHEAMARAGQISFDTNLVGWSALNQFTKEAKMVQLPRWLIGGNWLGQNTLTNFPSPIVDEVKHQTRDHCTLFQRMNDEGDMLRVDTSVVNLDGSRAIGTYIPHQNPDGDPSPVVAAVLQGQTYRGRAFVVNEWHEAAYEPIWDAAKTSVVGMLYVGTSLTILTKDIHDSTTNVVVGKTGYIYVLDSKGNYLISQHGTRDGENIWNAKDANDRLFVQAIVEKAKKMSGGAVTNDLYFWKNSADSVPREKFVALTYFAPWDWVIGGGAYEDDFRDGCLQARQAMNNLVGWAIGVALVAFIVAWLVSWLLSNSFIRPILQVIDRLNGNADQTVSAAGQVAAASQSLAEGASQQAASIEETSSSLEEMSSMTKRNAENSRQANDLARQTRTAADKGVADMHAMSTAMADIKTSSDDVAKIVKTIDEIAFQTNILALNAAVEAARAGEAGMGFAVVADEVRNLAQRSAQAAKETAAKIEGAIAKTSQGVELSGKVSGALQEIVGKARQMDELAAEVAGASNEQSQGIAQVNMAVGQMDKVTQSNAAGAEECAAAAEELNGQAQSMREAVGELLQLVGGQNQPAAAAVSPAAARPTKPGKVAWHTPAANGNGHSAKRDLGSPKLAARRRSQIPMGGDFKDF